MRSRHSATPRACRSWSGCAEVGVCVTHLAAKTGLAQSTISSYMSSLERVGLVRSTRVGKWTHYRRNDAQVDDLLGQIKNHI